MLKDFSGGIRHNNKEAVAQRHLCGQLLCSSPIGEERPGNWIDSHLECLPACLPVAPKVHYRFAPFLSASFFPEQQIVDFVANLSFAEISVIYSDVSC